MKQKITNEQKKRLREKQKRRIERTQLFIEKENYIKAALKDRIITALTIAPALGVMILSSSYQLLSTSLYGIDKTPMLLMGYLSLIAVIGSIALAVVHERVFTTAALALLFMMSFFCYLSFVVGGTTDVIGDGFFEMLMLALSIPLWSYMSVSMSIADPPYVPALVIAGIISALSIAASAYIIAKKRKRTKE